MVVYLNPLDSNSELLNILSLASVFPIFQFIVAAGFPPFEMHVSFILSPAMSDKVLLESTCNIFFPFSIFKLRTEFLTDVVRINFYLENSWWFGGDFYNQSHFSRPGEINIVKTFICQEET